VEERERVLASFLDTHADALGLACHAVARAFTAGATLVACGTDAAATDAAHVAVEFMHPVIVGKRALPALASPSLARPGHSCSRIVPRGTPGWREESEP